MARSRWSPLSLFLCAVFFFSAQVFAVSAVLGIDLGTEYIKAALVKPGIPLEIVLTKDSRRKEASAVAFKPSQNGPKAGAYPERLYGSDAMALAPRFSGDVYPNLKTLLGLPVTDPVVTEYAARHPGLQIEADKTRITAAFKSKGAFTQEEEAWLVEELLAMQLQSVQKNAESLAGSGTTVRSVVLTVPPFFTVEEKRAVELAAELAGLRVLSLISDGLAVGLHYATSRQFPNVNDGAKPEIHMVFDMGAGSTKATVMKFQSRTVKDVGKFNKTVQEVQVLGSGWDRTLGGDALNSLIVDDMVAQFVDSPAAKKAGVTADKVKAHGRAVAKLTKDAERLRHVLSANSNTQASFEGLFDDVDFKYKIERTAFEKMAEAHADRVAVAVRNALAMAGLKDADLDSVILHGGASRTPFVQKQLEGLFGNADKLRTNVNSDEAAVFGAGFRAADISPSFRVKEIRVSEGASYPAGIKWTNSKGKLQHQRLWTPTSHLGAQPKEITFSNKEDFTVEFYQQVPSQATASDLVQKPTKLFATKNLTATVAMLGDKYGCDTTTASFKAAMRLSSENGEVEITKAAVECEVEDQEKEGFVDGVKNLFGFGKSKDQEPLKGEEATASGEETLFDASSTSTESTSSSASTQSSSSATTTASSAAEPSDAKEKVLKKKLVSIPVDYSLEKAGNPQLSKTQIASLKDRLKAFTASDRSRQQREEALNQLEAFTYKVRDLLDSESFIAVSSDEERSKLEKQSSETSDWLYGDGADASRDELKKKLKALQDIVGPIQNRIDENAKRPELVQGLKDALKQTDDFVKSIKEKIAEHKAFLASSSSSSTTTEASSTTAAPSKDDFDGLEDEDAASTTKEPDMDDVLKERGPVPPLYTLEDLKESEDLFKTVTAWLDEKIAEQAKLGPADDPVLTIKDLKLKREKLDKAGMDLAMKAVRNFEGKNKKKAKSKSSKTKKPKSSKTDEPAAGQTIKLNVGEDGQIPSNEELEEILKQYKAEQEQNQGAKKEEKDGEAVKHDEL
ncbi:uncharacterized protein E0L32_011918 [Thyridium curvatum]|uniref:Uncharacterized protein n=1 Tax=Thyridium curvatum TaxID=1093900 RepID=A0A507BDJ8_9PEZI|nr:uncharacterized protein E0L32_011918 [Thyridium curvatum]TPX18007.1 hypothetical protein E0L32_011918 [Thyridium curvatum]